MWKIDDFIKFSASRDTYCTLKGLKGRMGSEHSERVHSNTYGTLISCERLSNPYFGNRIKAKPRKFLSPDTAKYELCFWESFWFRKNIFRGKADFVVAVSAKTKDFPADQLWSAPKTCWNHRKYSFLSLRLNQVEWKMYFQLAPIKNLFPSTAWLRRGSHAIDETEISFLICRGWLSN